MWKYRRTPHRNRNKINNPIFQVYDITYDNTKLIHDPTWQRIFHKPTLAIVKPCIILHNDILIESNISTLIKKIKKRLHHVIILSYINTYQFELTTWKIYHISNSTTIVLRCIYKSYYHTSWFGVVSKKYQIKTDVIANTNFYTRSQLNIIYNKINATSNYSNLC